MTCSFVWRSPQRPNLVTQLQSCLSLSTQPKPAVRFRPWLLRQIAQPMNDLPVIGSAVMRKGFWDRQGGNIASRSKKMYGEKFFCRPKRRFLRAFDDFSQLFYQKMGFDNVDTWKV